jgi:hypothetical protein
LTTLFGGLYSRRKHPVVLLNADCHALAAARKRKGEEE